jgi:hypothetical protein
MIARDTGEMCYRTMLTMRGLLASLILGIAFLSAGRMEAAEEIRVPFNFRWGDSPALVEDTIKRAKAQVVERKTVGGKKQLVVEGHPDKRLMRSVFSFDNDALVEVELQYSDSSWDTAKIQAVFEQTRRNLDRKYGTSRNIARQTSRVEGGVTQTILGYQWTQSYTSLRLVLFIAEKDAETVRVLSYHYRGY